MARKIIIPKGYSWGWVMLTKPQLDPPTDNEIFLLEILKDIVNNHLKKHPNVSKLTIKEAGMGSALAIQYRVHHKNSRKKFVTCRAWLQWDHNEHIKINMMSVGRPLPSPIVINPAAEHFYQEIVRWLAEEGIYEEA